MARYIQEGTRRVAGRETARGKQGKPLPFHLQVRPMRARPTRVNNGKVERSFPMYEGMSRQKLRSRFKRARPTGHRVWEVYDMERGFLGYTNEEGAWREYITRREGYVIEVK